MNARLQSADPAKDSQPLAKVKWSFKSTLFSDQGAGEVSEAIGMLVNRLLTHGADSGVEITDSGRLLKLTHDSSGELVMVSYRDNQNRILKVVWELNPSSREADSVSVASLKAVPMVKCKWSFKTERFSSEGSGTTPETTAKLLTRLFTHGEHSGVEITAKHNDLTLTKNSEGLLVMVSYQDEEHRVTELVWERGAPQVASVDLTDEDLRVIWRAAGGGFHGPHVETGTMPESQLLNFLRQTMRGQYTRLSPTEHVGKRR